MLNTAAQDSLVRLGLTGLLQDPRAVLPDAERAWLTARLQPPADGAYQPFTASERARVTAVLLAYLEAYFPRTSAVVRVQWTEEED